MPEIIFFNSKSGELSCTVDGIALHSKYNPLQEALRFIENIKCDFIPQNIIITEPGIFHCHSLLKEKFPKAKIYAVHYSQEISSHSFSENKILIDTEEKANNFSTTLYNLLGEEGIYSTLFLSWTASGNAFKNLDNIVWKEIKNSVELSRTILSTRSHFSDKWFLNSVNNLIHAKNKCIFTGNSKPVVVCASGPSLKNCLKTLIEYRDSYFLLAVSSAALPLLKNNIIPDAVISTDGGFWAKKHLEILREYKQLPLILSCEGNCPRQVLYENPVLFLTYPDGSASELVNSCEIPGFTGLRNGTVSGTAIDFAKKITASKVFAFGLDLAASKGFQHTNPNKLEIINSCSDNKLKTTEKRLTASRFQNSSLKIYQDWFKALPFDYAKNVFRVSDNYNFGNNLGFITDINLESFINELSNQKKLKQNCFKSIEKNSVDTEKLKKIILEISETDEWKKEFFTADYISMNKESDSSKKKDIYNKIIEKNAGLVKKALRILK